MGKNLNKFVQGFLTLLLVLLARDVNSACATITWIAPGDDGNVGRAALYDIRYSTTYIDDYTWNFATRLTTPPRPKPAGSLEHVEFYELEPATVYYFAIKTADEVINWSVLSTIITVETPEDICEGYTGNANCSEDGSRNLADITWLVDHVYITRTPLCCPAKANVDGDPNNVINLSDITRLIDHVYLTGRETAPCP